MIAVSTDARNSDSALPISSSTLANIETIAGLLNTPGQYVARCPPEEQASIAASAIIRAGVRRSLTIVPANYLAIETEQSYCASGLKAHAFPTLGSSTCLVWDRDLAMATDIGIPVSATRCPTCEYRTKCAYQQDRAAAEHSDHLIVTAHRASLSPPDRVGNRQAVLLLGAEPLSVLRPARDVHIGEVQVGLSASAGQEFVASSKDVSRDLAWASASLQALAHAVECNLAEPEDAFEPPVDPDGFWARTRDVIWRINEALLSGAVRDIELPTRRGTRNESVREWGNALWPFLRDSSIKPKRGVVSLVMSAATGKLDKLAIHPDAVLIASSARPKPPQMPVSGSLVGVWPLSHFPTDVAVVALNTLHVRDLTRVTGVTWSEIETICPTPRADNVTQFARRVTSQTSPRQLLGVLRWHLMKVPGNIGVVGREPLLKRLASRMKTDSWSSVDRNRLRLVAWGADYTKKLGNCGLVLTLGAPRPHPQAVFRRLLQLDDSAALEDSCWGKSVEWETDSPDGGRLALTGHGYGHPRWQAVDGEMVHSVLRRLLRAVSCSIVVLADEKLDLPMAKTEPPTLSNDCYRVLRALEEELHAPPCVCGPTTDEIAHALGKSRRAVQLQVARLHHHGFVCKVTAGPRSRWIPNNRVEQEANVLGDAALAVFAFIRDCATSDKSPTRLDNTYSIIVGEMSDVAQCPSASTSAIAKQTDLPQKTVCRHLRHLCDMGVVLRVGEGTNTRWTLMRLAFPDAVEDKESAEAFREAQAKLKQPAAGRSPMAQGQLLFATAELKAKLMTAIPAGQLLVEPAIGA